MKKVQLGLYFLIVAAAAMMLSSYAPKPKKILVFSKTAGFRHASAIDAGKKGFIALGQANKFSVDTTENSSAFTPENLKQYAAVVFLCTTGDVLNDEQQKAFEQYIQKGGGYFGLHSSADTEYDWPWFGGLNGAYFKNHPRMQEAVFNVETNHISTAHLPKVWKRFDELYNFKWIGTDLNVVITIDENSYNGGQNGEHHPMAWYHEYDGGRAYYTALGHDNKSWEDPLYQQHVLGALHYAMGTKVKATAKSKSKSSATSK